MPNTIVCGLALTVLGCAASGPQVKPEQPTLAGWSGPPPAVRVVLEGPAANRDKRRACADVMKEVGVAADFDAPVTATLFLQDEGNRLRIDTRAGRVLDEPRPGWDMEVLCRDAIAKALRALREGGAAAMRPVASHHATLHLYRPPMYRARGLHVFVTLDKEIVRLRNGQRLTRTLDPRSITLAAAVGARGNSTSSVTLQPIAGHHYFVRCRMVAGGGWTADCEAVSEPEAQSEMAECDEEGGE